LSDGTVGTERAGIQLRNKDHSNQPVLIHGYPLDATSRERQQRELLANGDRDITHDRHGVGHSARPTADVDYGNRGLAEAAARTSVGPAGRGRGIGRPVDRARGGRRGGPRGAGAGAGRSDAAALSP
jgi:hypothetical protein